MTFVKTVKETLMTISEEKKLSDSLKSIYLTPDDIITLKLLSQDIPRMCAIDPEVTVLNLTEWKTLETLNRILKQIE